MNSLRALLIAGRHAARDALRGKRLVVLLGIAALPLLLLLLAPLNDAGEVEAETFHTALLMITFQLVVPFSALLLGVAVLGDEIEGRTVTYLFTRPVGRGTLYLGRLLGMGAAWSLVFALILGIGMHARPVEPKPLPADLWRPIAIGIGGFWAYFAAFALLRMLFKRALLTGMFYILIVDGFISKMADIGGVKLSLWHYMAQLHLATYEGERLRGFGFVAKTMAPEETAAGSVMVLVGVAVVGAALGMWVTRAKEYPVAGAVA